MMTTHGLEWLFTLAGERGTRARALVVNKSTGGASR